MIKNIKNINFKKIKNKNGELIFVESKSYFKRGFKRFFSVKANKNALRGGHSHYKGSQILFCLNGSINVFSYQKSKNKYKEYKLIKNKNYLFVPPNNFLKIKYLKSNSILGVLCDRYYEPDDYNYTIE